MLTDISWVAFRAVKDIMIISVEGLGKVLGAECCRRELCLLPYY